MSAYSPITAAPDAFDTHKAAKRAAGRETLSEGERAAFNRAYAQIAAPIGQRLGVIERFVNDDLAAEQAHGAKLDGTIARLDAAIARAAKAGLTAPVRVGTGVMA